MVWGKVGSTTLSSAGDNLDITSMTANKCNQFLVNSFYSGNTDGKMTFNDNSNSVYAFRRSLDGASDTTGINQVSMGWYWGTTIEFWVSYFVSVSGEEKLGISFGNVSGVTAGTAPHRMERVDKFVPSPDADITRIDRYNSDTGSFDTGSNITALGSEMTPAAAITFPTNVQVGSRAEITDSRKMYNFSKLTFDFSASSSGGVSNQPTDATEVGQLITSTTHRGKKAKSATFYVKRTGSPSGTMVYKIRKSSDNSVVATSTGTSASALSTSTTAVTLDFNDEVIPSENIRVTVSGVTGSSGNVVTIYGGGADTVADQSLSVWGGSSWTEYGNDCAGKLTFTDEWQEIGA